MSKQNKYKLEILKAISNFCLKDTEKILAKYLDFSVRNARQNKDPFKNINETLFIKYLSTTDEIEFVFEILKGTDLRRESFFLEKKNKDYVLNISINVLTNISLKCLKKLLKKLVHFHVQYLLSSNHNVVNPIVVDISKIKMIDSLLV
jgi:hypothetical protein